MMNIPDLITIFGNLSNSLLSVQRFIFGGAYLLGIIFFVTGLIKLKKMKEAGRYYTDNKSIPFYYLVSAASLFYLPSTITYLSNTTFGVGNILAYSNYNTKNIYYYIFILIQTVGFIWCVRGCVLFLYTSEPRTKLRSKGLLFLFAGILAINFENTINAVISLTQHF